MNICHCVMMHLSDSCRHRRSMIQTWHGRLMIIDIICPAINPDAFVIIFYIMVVYCVDGV